jgi:hypothetical protein
MRDTTPLTTVDCIFLKVCSVRWVLDSREAMPLRRSPSSTSSGLMSCASQIHLNYEAMENQLRTAQDVLAVVQ